MWQAGADESRAVAEYFEFLEDLERPEYLGYTWTAGNTQTSRNAPLGVLAVLGGLGMLRVLGLQPMLRVLGTLGRQGALGSPRRLGAFRVLWSHFRRSSPDPESARCTLKGRQPHG